MLMNSVASETETVSPFVVGFLLLWLAGVRGHCTLFVIILDVRMIVFVGILIVMGIHSDS